MRTMNVLIRVKLWVLLILAVIFVIMLNGCGEYEPDVPQTNTSENLSVNATDDGQQSSNQTTLDLPPTEDELYEEIDKLDFHVYEIIRDYEQDNLGKYFQSSVIKIQDDRLLVTITVGLGDLNEINEIIVKAGGEISGSYNNSIDAWVPIKKIILLTEEECIQYIEIPLPDIEEMNN